MVGMGKDEITDAKTLLSGCLTNDISLLFPDLEGGRYFFNAVKEGDSILWACDDENECHLWVMALYRATGQAHKPTPLTSNTPKTAGLCKTQAGKWMRDE